MIRPHFKTRIIPPIFYFDSEEERREAVDHTYHALEECNIPFIAVLLTKHGLDIELVNLTENQARPYVKVIEQVYKTHIDKDYVHGKTHD